MEVGAFFSSLKNCFKSITRIGTDDPRRVLHSLKVATALTLLSIIYWGRAVYGITRLVMSVMTVVGVFEFSVVWAGEDLHILLASNIETLANCLIGFEVNYFDNQIRDKSVLQGYETVLKSEATEESLTNLARWEPAHGFFRPRHPWNQYKKIGAFIKKCASKIESLHDYLNPEIPISSEFKFKIKKPCSRIITELYKALKVISSSTEIMVHPSAAKRHIEKAKAAAGELNFFLETVSLEEAKFLSIIPVGTVAFILEEITQLVEKIYQSIAELSELAEFKNVGEVTVSPEKPHVS
ncbi:hypothetical protein V8G54_019919 [Vigna mungo]|uniref:Aluminum-activated malate transporter n=1 Tax=Vigna mungo TaxID=3915 RepID=A0AAQ3RW83_VIGMU